MLLSDGTHVDRIGVLSTHASFFRERAVVCLVLPLVGCVQPIPVITLGLLFEPQLRYTVHIFHAFILLYVLLGYFHVLPFADMWDIEHLGHSALIRLQRIYNFLLFHAILYSVLDD